jgi:hypothetical protein
MELSHGVRAQLWNWYAGGNCIEEVLSNERADAAIPSGGFTASAQGMEDEARGGFHAGLSGG